MKIEWIINKVRGLGGERGDSFVLASIISFGCPAVKRLRHYESEASFSVRKRSMSITH